MHIRNDSITLAVACCVFCFAATSHAGQFQIDFAGLSGSAAGWDVFDNLAQGVANPLTDLSGGGDDDVTLTSLDDSFSPNNPAPPGTSAIYDGVLVPAAARDDYLFKTDDTAGTTARLRIDNLDAGVYNITVFQGRQSDSSQFAKIWVGDAAGSGEPATENTGNFAGGNQGFATVTVDVGAGDTLWYRHLEDNTGGISGMIIRIPEPATAILMGLGMVILCSLRRRR